MSEVLESAPEMSQGRKLTVPCDEYPTIASAISSLQPGDVILLAAQEFKEQIIIKNCRFPVVIEGVANRTFVKKDYDREIGREEDRSAVYVEDSEGITLRNLYISCGAEFGEAMIAAACRHISIDRCKFHRYSDRNVIIRDTKSPRYFGYNSESTETSCPVDLTISNSTLSSCKLSVGGAQTNVKLVNCHFGDSAVCAEIGGKFLMDRCCVVDCESSGLAISAPEIELSNCIIDFNKGNGVSLRGNQCTVTGCKIMNNSGWGVSVANGGVLSLTDDNWIKGNGKGKCLGLGVIE